MRIDARARTSGRAARAAVLMVAVGLVAVSMPWESAASTCLPGSGTSSDPFLVASAADLAKVGADAANGCTLAAHYRQTADIMLSVPTAPDTSNHTPIGAASPFTGVYDGRGHAVDGVVLDTTGIGGTAFFADVRSGGIVRDVRLTDLSVRSAGGSNTAGVVGVSVDAEVSDVHVEGSVTGDRSKLGGLIAYAERTTIVRSSMTGTVTMTGTAAGSGDWVGGLVGHAVHSDIEDSHASVSIVNAHPDGELTGGLVGELEGSTASIVRSSASGTVEGWSLLGGLLGYLYNRAQIREVTSSAAVVGRAGSRYVGGLLGAMNVGTTVVDASASGPVTTPADGTDVAALIGWGSGFGSAVSTVQRSVATGRVSGPSAGSGGSFAYVDTMSVAITDAYWDRATTGQPTSGGEGAGAIGATSAQLTSLATYGSWPIVAGWAPHDRVANRVWGICPLVNDGYPFLLWEYDADPCTVPAAFSTPSLLVSCAGPDGEALTGGVVASCTVTGGDPDIDIVWRAAYNPVFAEGVVRTGADGTGTFSFTVPVAAAGSPVTVELVAWTAPIPVGTVAGASGGPVPTSIPAGDVPGPALPAAVALLGLFVLATLLQHRRRTLAAAIAAFVALAASPVIMSGTAAGAAPAAPTVAATITVGAQPWGVAFSPDGAKAYVGDSGWPGSISVIDVATRQVATLGGGVVIVMGAGPAGVAVTPDGSKVFVTAYSAAFDIFAAASDGVLTVSAADLTVAASGIGCVNPLAITMRDDATAAYVGCDDGRIRAVDTASSASSHVYQGGRQVRDIAYVPRGTKAGDDIAFIENVITGPTSGNFRLLNAGMTARLAGYGMSVAVDGTGERAYVGDETGVLSVFDIAGQALLHTINVGGDLRGIALSQDGRFAYVTDHVGDSLKVVDLVARSVVHTVPAGDGALRVALSPDERTALVTNNIAGTVTLIDLPVVTPVTAPAAAPPSMSVSCSGPLAAAATATCAVMDGPADIDIVWRASYNPVFAEGVVRTGGDGTGTFSFTVPVAAAGSPVTVELVAWTAPIPVGTVAGVAGGPVPASIPAGDGPEPVLPTALSLLVVASVVALRHLGRRKPMSDPGIG